MTKKTRNRLLARRVALGEVAAAGEGRRPKFGVVSVGTPETAATAARQDVVAEAAKVLA